MSTEFKPIFTRLRALLALAVAGVLMLLPTGVAFAHANLVRSNPERGAVLAQPPKTITLEFSENLDPQLSQVQLLDAHGTVVAAGPGVIDGANPRVMRLDLPKLDDGSYSEVWQTHSAADGHFANGTVSFSVGKANSSISLLPAENTPLPTEATPAALDVILRWAGYLAAALLGGGILFAGLVWRPAYRAAAAEPDAPDDRTATRLLKTEIRIGAAALAVVTAAAVVYQAVSGISSSSQVDFWTALGGLVSFGSNWQLWLRLLVLGCIILFSFFLDTASRDKAWDWLALIPLAVVVFATVSLKSHAAALNNPLALILDTLHLTAMSAWFGGLLPLFLLLRRTQIPPKVLVPFFTRVALTSVCVLALSGLYAGLEQVRTLDELVSTSYGLALIVKVIIFGVLVGLGALNFRVLTPRLGQDTAKATRQLRLSMRFEMLLGLSLLAAVGVLTGASPSFEATQATRQMGVVGETQQDGIRMRLWLAPGFTGENEVAVDVAGLPEMDQMSTTQVILRFKLLDKDLGTTQAGTVTEDYSRYVVRGSYFTLAGNWTIQVILRRPGQNDIVHVFPVFIQTDPNDTDPPNPRAVTPDSVAAGKALYQQNCVVCHGTTGKGDGPAGKTLNPPPADLTYHTIPGVHTDGQLFYWISQGLPRTSMPQFAQVLTEDQRWDLVNFIRTLARQTN